jgi:hypothetical protein
VFIVSSYTGYFANRLRGLPDSQVFFPKRTISATDPEGAACRMRATTNPDQDLPDAKILTWMDWISEGLPIVEGCGRRITLSF